jgi:hypothetical protein
MKPPEPVSRRHLRSRPSVNQAYPSQDLLFTTVVAFPLGRASASSGMFDFSLDLAFVRLIEFLDLDFCDDSSPPYTMGASSQYSFFMTTLLVGGPAWIRTRTPEGGGF